MCDYAYFAEAKALCTNNNGNCDTDIDECLSKPCKNGAVCSDSTDAGNVRVGTYMCACVKGFQSGTAGNCEIDSNECASKPCKNGAICTDSTAETMVAVNTYQCTCAAGYANGVCEYAFIKQYQAQCSNPTGNCNVDVNECLSSPCVNGAVCSDSTTSATVSANAYKCACKAGYGGGNCDVDVDECSSSPCKNGAACDDSTSSNGKISINAYRCSCEAGFANGACVPGFIAQYKAQCSVMESDGQTVQVNQPFPSTDQAKTAAKKAFVITQASKLGVDPSRIVVSAMSRGK